MGASFCVIFYIPIIQYGIPVSEPQLQLQHRCVYTIKIFTVFMPIYILK
jgi:hypothetical protein